MQYIIPTVSLIGIFVTLWISIRTLRATHQLEKYRKSLSFSENSLNYLREARKVVSGNIDLRSINKAIIDNDKNSVMASLKLHRERYMIYYNLYTEIRHLFNPKDRTHMDNTRTKADTLDSELYSQIIDVESKDKDRLKNINRLLPRFLEASYAFQESLREIIETTMTKISDSLRDQ